MAMGIDKTLNTPAVLVTGASSQIGFFALPRLVAAGYRVLALSRAGKPRNYPDLEQLEWLTDIHEVRADEHCETLLSAGPLELAQQILSAGKQYRSAVIFSSSSVISKQKSADPAERKQIQGMLSLESELESIGTSRALKLVILRPTMIYGCGLDTNISRLAGWIHRFGFMPVNGKASGLRKPVHADDLAAAAVAALLSKDPLPRSLFLAGGSTLSYADMVCRIFSALDKPARLLHLPQWLFVLLVSLSRAFNPALGINSEMVRRQAIDLVFDDRQARELLAYKPRPFAPSAKDFTVPE